MAESTGEPRLSLRGVSKSFHGIPVLTDINLDVVAGEVHAIVGENGAGKSTLMKIVAGAHQPSSGTIALDGEMVTFTHPLQARHAGIGIVYQELNLLPDRTVTENLYLGAELQAGWHLDRSAMEQGARDALRAAGVSSKIGPRTMARDLSVADRQVVEIARALMADTRVVIFDEPTAALAGHEAEELFTRIRRLQDDGIAVLYVSHRLPEVFELSERITVLKDGALVGTVDTAATNRRQIVAMMVGRELASYYPDRAAPGDVGATRLRVVGGSNADLTDINLELRAGEIVGVAGLAGSGRTELARALFGVAPFTTGSVEIDGALADLRTPRAAIRHGLAFVTEDRKAEGLVLDANAQDNGTARPSCARPRPTQRATRRSQRRRRRSPSCYVASTSGPATRVRPSPCSAVATSRRSCSPSGWRRTPR